MGRLDNKVVFITGAARGQGRSHAIRMAEEGAAIIAVDICDQIPSVFYPMSTKEDLDETVELVRGVGGRIIAEVADVRDRDALEAAYKLGIAEFGHVDTVLANAGIMPVINEGAQRQAWFDGIDTMLTGVWHTMEVALPGMIARGQGGSILITSSAAGLGSIGLNTLPGQAAYSAAKHGVVGLMRLYASQLAVHGIRVNTVHPGGTATPMVINDGYRAFVEEFPEIAAGPKFQNPMHQPPLDPINVSQTMVFLASDDAKYITGVTLSVDAGYMNR
ncbi:mycofactocin-coupled SDR family oxidoreductase [Pseudarthrobacter sulfonivorans]|uniref:mycofactocin-coupled SDR family oxidoreductase n=1 Tax=Pseudarthrobacter sulfonivorans TaxID=121292 RepID=UPI00168B242E|nr:mycofactocin-coupled SDR family oxidoreductase [Pseudarthrobacter sulfonivorans]